MAGGGKGAEISCVKQDGRGGLDSDFRHGNQDLGKRVGIDHRFDFGGHQGALSFGLLFLLGNPGYDQLHGSSTRHVTVLLC